MTFKKLLSAVLALLPVFAIAATSFAYGQVVYVGVRDANETEEKQSSVLDGFSDLDPDAWYIPGVEFVAKDGVMVGLPGGIFAPDLEMTRAMTVTVIWRMSGMPTPESDPGFEDITGDWYRDAVAWAAESGLVKGVSDKRFDPDAPMTREQLATVFYRIASLRGGETGDYDDDALPFSDSDAVSDYARPAVRWAVEKGVLIGTGDGFFAPGSDATRAQVATVLGRFDGSFPDAFANSAEKFTGFAVKLLDKCRKNGENSLVSPLSVLAALGMASNGARGGTLTEIESAFGMSVPEINDFLGRYINGLPQGEKYKLSVADSVWIRDDDRFVVKDSFLAAMRDLYAAEVRRVPFNEKTLGDINGWVNEKTDGMIPSILDRIPEEAAMYLINALAFEAEWGSEYLKSSVRQGVFTLADGSAKQVEYMYSDEHSYLSCPGAQGVIKYYYGGKYAFAAILPDPGHTVSEILSSLNGETLHNMLSDPEIVTVETAIPKFEADYDAELSGVLGQMGIIEAFDRDLADFSGLGSWEPDGNIYINRVIHKTFISVAENGTKAGAATAVEMGYATSVGPGGPQPKRVYLTRPFIYMLIDTENRVPFFIGTVEDIGK